jgi:hypothetical protein
LMTADESFAWIFQANPKRFAVGTFASNPPLECEWLVSRYQRDIRPGQRVFLWCAAGDSDLPSGIFAEALTLTGVRNVADDSPPSLWTDPDEGREAHPRVRIALSRIATKREVIKRDWWLRDPALSDQLIITMPNHTTFRLEGTAYQRLERLWTKTGSDWTYEDAVGGLYAFVETLNGPVSKLPGSIVSDVAQVVGRPITGIYNKVMNFRSLDPEDARKGFDGASGQDRAVWDAFYDPLTGLNHEAIRAEYANLWSQPLPLSTTKSADTQRSGTRDAPGGLSKDLFRTELAWLSGKLEQTSASPFRSFQEGLPHVWEGYKLPLRTEALARLDLASWTEDVIGSGKILEHAIRAIEISGPGGLKNNLVGWQNQYGHASRSHKALLDACGDAPRTAVVEGLLYEFFLRGLPEDVAFARFKDAGIKSYDLNAYLFFLLDGNRYMPIRPTTFDPVLKRLGFEFSTTSQCSSENYQQFNDALRDVQHALLTTAGIADARLIDAHSFCWLLGRIEQAETSKPALRKSATSGLVYDGRRRSIYEMVKNALAAASAGNGQLVERTLKNKEVRMSRHDLEDYVDSLIEKQEGLCALTGLALQFHKEHDDEQLLASLDRIDSAGHYEHGNLQVVCRFANKWKSDSHTDEFVRLLALVRNLS